MPVTAGAGPTPPSAPAPDETASPSSGDGAAGNLPWLYAGRALRSFTTAFLTVVFPLYLVQQGQSAATIGIVLTLGSILGAGLVAGVGVVGDRMGRRPVLVGVGLLGAAGALGLAVSGNLAVVIVASGLGGIGRGGGAGSGGAFGPFFPAEQPLLAASVPAARRTHAFGRLGFLGVLSAAAGSLVAGLPTLLHHIGLSALDAYRIVFVLGAAGSLAVAAVSLPLRDPRPAGPAGPAEPAGPVGSAEPAGPVGSAEPAGPAVAAGSAEPAGAAGAAVAERSLTGAGPAADPPAIAGIAPSTLTTRQLVGRLGLTNALNGFGFGFLGPLLTYWFHVRFGAGPATVGALYTGVNLLSALPYLGAHRLTRRLGAVRTVVVTRGASVVALLAMAAAPTFVVAAALLAARTMCNSLGLPARQAYTMGVADERRRGTVAALGALPSMFTSSVSPVVGGALMGLFVDVPIVGAAVFMAANTLTYYLAFRHAPLPEEDTCRGASSA